ncbi:MAG: hypothetical protein ACOCVF_04260 [bacterium]
MTRVKEIFNEEILPISNALMGKLSYDSLEDCIKWEHDCLGIYSLEDDIQLHLEYIYEHDIEIIKEITDDFSLEVSQPEYDETIVIVYIHD